MKKSILPIILTLSLLTACGTTTPPETNEDTTTILASTYPIYILANALTVGIPDVTIEMLGTGTSSCLHDYTLSVSDMKVLEQADILTLNGAGLEDFMDDALNHSSAIVISAADGVTPTTSTSTHNHGEDDILEHDTHEHDTHEHEGEDNLDPHFWLDPIAYESMMDTIAVGLVDALPEFADTIQSNADEIRDPLVSLVSQGQADLASLENRELITFHDGFSYFAHRFDLELLTSIEEEAGSEASAQEIAEIIALIDEHDINAIFTETNGSDSTAKAISRETGCAVASLNLLMSGAEIESGLTSLEIISTYYISIVEKNLATIMEALG